LGRAPHPEQVAQLIRSAICSAFKRVQRQRNIGARAAKFRPRTAKIINYRPSSIFGYCPYHFELGDTRRQIYSISAQPARHAIRTTRDNQIGWGTRLARGIDLNSHVAQRSPAGGWAISLSRQEPKLRQGRALINTH
jgi:hypothetical protein